MTHLFDDRREAGAALARELRKLPLEDPVVLALPRGGVPVGYEVARELSAPLDILLVRKIGASGHEEYGIGAIVDGDPAHLVIDDAAARATGATRDYVAHQVALQSEEIERRRKAYGTGARVELAGRTVVLVDDGIATGGTVRAALQGLGQARCRKVVLAVPVAPSEVVEALRPLCDRIVCLRSPEPFFAVGAHYSDFRQTSDEEVVGLLVAAKRFGGVGAKKQVDHYAKDAR